MRFLRALYKVDSAGKKDCEFWRCVSVLRARELLRIAEDDDSLAHARKSKAAEREGDDERHAHSGAQKGDEAPPLQPAWNLAPLPDVRRGEQTGGGAVGRRCGRIPKALAPLPLVPRASGPRRDASLQRQRRPREKRAASSTTNVTVGTTFAAGHLYEDALKQATVHESESDKARGAITGRENVDARGTNVLLALAASPKGNPATTAARGEARRRRARYPRKG